MNLHKYKKIDADRLFAHYERKKDENGDYIRFKNINIDKTLTPKNYNLAKAIQPLPQKEFFEKRLKEIKVLKRADVNSFCTWVITVPQELPKEDSNKFLKICFDYLCERYGKKNVISAYVHLDETTPHMHFTYLPVVIDKKTGKEKLSAKESTTPSDLKCFHNKLQVYVTQRLGYPIILATGITEQQGGDQTVKQLMELTRKQCLELSKKINEQNKINTELAQELERQKEATKQAEANSAKLQKVIDDGVATANTKLGILENPRTKLKDVSAALIASENKCKQLEQRNEALTRDNSHLVNDLQKERAENRKNKPAADKYNFINQYAPNDLRKAYNKANENKNSGYGYRNSSGSSNGWGNSK